MEMVLAMNGLAAIGARPRWRPQNETEPGGLLLAPSSANGIRGRWSSASRAGPPLGSTDDEGDPACDEGGCREAHQGDDQHNRVGHGVRPRSQSDRKSTRLNSSHVAISYAVFC